MHHLGDVINKYLKKIIIIKKKKVEQSCGDGQEAIMPPDHHTLQRTYIL